MMNFELLDYISLNNTLIEKLTDLADKDEVSILRFSERLFKGNTACLSGKSPLFKLAVTLKAGEKTHVLYKEHGISDDIFKATFSDIAIWCENCGNIGLENVGWLKNHICFELFRFGRLQFQMFTCSNPTLNYSKLPFSINEKAVYIHIPQGEKLNYCDCVKSIKSADTFFKKHFFDFSYSYYFCESWLLFEDNKLFMHKNSNIIKFMSLFDIHYSAYDESQAFERIFNTGINFNSLFNRLNKRKRKSDINCLLQSTSLQKSAKEYLISGGRLGVGIATIPKNKYSDL